MFCSICELLEQSITMDIMEYKKLQDDHISNLNGTTRFETIIQVAPIPLCTLLSLLAVPLLLPGRCGRSTANFIIFGVEFCILVLPITLTLTALNERLHLVVICLLVLVSLAVCSHTIKYPHRDYRKYLKELWVSEVSSENVPLITMFRAITNLVTVLCILAVDFTIFPRKFAKTEYFGYSVMDVGVGLFCISNAIVSSEVKHANNVYHSSKNISKTLRSCVPLFMLGIARSLTVRNIDYQVHVTEYGVHWNFFLTLAFVRILSSVIFYLTGCKYVGLLSVSVVFFQQCLLNAGIQGLVLAPNTRSNLVMANCEGLASLAGYLAIYFAGVCIGGIIRNTGKLFCDYVLLTVKLALGILVMWKCTVLADYCFGVSRRLANSGYVVWVLCVTLIFFEMFLFSTLTIHSIKIYATKKNRQFQLDINYVPMLYEAINFNGLVFFLYSNILTGAVNLCFYTLSFSKFYSIITVILYMGTVCLTVATLYWKKIKLKFW